jgi:hypothetical protein
MTAIRQRLASAAACCLLLGSLAAADQHSGPIASGHCNFIQKNIFVGPHAVCVSPIEATACDALGHKDDNRDAVYAPGDCRLEGALGTCDLGDSRLMYYEGDASALEIGCGFQGGAWTPHQGGS